MPAAIVFFAIASFLWI